jgi:hypothetical protein
MIIIDNIEQGSDDWHNCRLGVATASRSADFSQEPSLSPMPDVEIVKVGKLNQCVFEGVEYSDSNKASIVTAIRESLPRVYSESRNGYMCELVAEVCTGLNKEQGKFKQTEWGHDNEDSAREFFSFETGLEVETVAFIYADESKRFGISPDGMIKGQKKGLELKCPYDSKVFIEFAVFGRIKPEYIEQCQYSMWVTGYDAWYFASYDPRMKTKQLHYVEILRDEAFMEKYDTAKDQFIKDMDFALRQMAVNYGSQFNTTEI